MERRLHRVLTMADLPTFVGLRRSQIDELIRQGQFPRPVRPGLRRRRAWLESEVIEWQASKIAERDNA
jgi:predicted DNA-binding transcriptional regulator AlpA